MRRRDVTLPCCPGTYGARLGNNRGAACCRPPEGANGEGAVHSAARLGEERKVFFPLFAGHHWIAGVLRRGGSAGRGPLLGVYDSAPSDPVRRDWSRVFGVLWPGLVIHEEALWTAGAGQWGPRP